jgi:chlorite dismutase
VSEYGGKKDGVRQCLDRRLFVQLLVFDGSCASHAEGLVEPLSKSLKAKGVRFVIYADLQSPRGLGLLTWSESPETFVRDVRGSLMEPDFKDLAPRHAFNMFGRTYSTGHEPDLEHALLRRSEENVLNSNYPWHIWYPLRRTGAFAKLDPHEQAIILREHATLGMAYGQQELAHDIRLACHGLDADDNEFVIGLVGRELHPLSHLVQSMRKTKQTSEYIAKMGPFFVGYVLSRS